MRGKRLAALCLCTSLLCGHVAAAKEVPVYTDTEEGVEVSVLLNEDDSLWEPTDVPADAAALELKGKGIVLMDIDTGTVLYEQDSRVETKAPVGNLFATVQKSSNFVKSYKAPRLHKSNGMYDNNPIATSGVFLAAIARVNLDGSGIAVICTLIFFPVFSL